MAIRAVKKVRDEHFGHVSSLYESTMWLDLSDGRSLGVPLAWFPRLLRASPEQLAHCKISRTGLHWEDLDEDVSVFELLQGRGDRTRGTNEEHKRSFTIIVGGEHAQESHLSIGSKGCFQSLARRSDREG